MKIPHMPWFFDRAGSPGDSRITPPAILPSALSDGVGTPISLISRLNRPACTYPCPTLRCALTERQRMARGHRGSLLLRCRALPSPSPCRFIPALSTQCTFSSRTGGISPTWVHDAPASTLSARSAPQPRHSRGAGTVSLRSGTAAGASPDPLRPGCPPGLRSFDRTRYDRCARRFPFAASKSCDGGVEEFELSLSHCRFNEAFSARNSALAATTASNRTVNRSTNDRSPTTSAASSS